MSALRTPYERGSLGVFLSVCVLGCVLVRVERAQAAEAGGADELFKRGKQRLAVGDLGEACPLLAESYRLDPATGTLLALALCHEREGKLATALAEYRDAVVRSRVQRRSDRVRAAQDKIAHLERKVSTLTIDGAGVAEGVEVRLNGAVLEPSQLGKALPFDGGDLTVEASAPGRVPWRASVALAPSGDAQTVSIPELQPQPAPEIAARPELQAEPAAAAAAPVVARDERATSRFSAPQWAGIGLMAGGGVALAVGVGFTVRAIRKDDDSELGCFDDLCTPAARADRLEARDAGNAATIAIASGAALATAGLVSYLVGRRRERPGHAARRALDAAAFATPHVAGAAVRRSF